MGGLLCCDFKARPHSSNRNTNIDKISRILELVSVHAPTMPLHVACMHHLPYLHSKLFMLAHELVEKEPEAAISWYTVGVWYLTSRKWGEARKYFRYAFSRFGLGWVFHFEL